MFSYNDLTMLSSTIKTKNTEHVFPFHSATFALFFNINTQ